MRGRITSVYILLRNWSAYFSKITFSHRSLKFLSSQNICVLLAVRRKKWHNCGDTVNQYDNPSELWPSVKTRTIEKQGMDHSDKVKFWLYTFSSQIYFAFIKLKMKIKILLFEAVSYLATFSQKIWWDN